MPGCNLKSAGTYPPRGSSPPPGTIEPDSQAFPLGLPGGVQPLALPELWSTFCFAAFVRPSTPSLFQSVEEQALRGHNRGLQPRVSIGGRRHRRHRPSSFSSCSFLLYSARRWRRWSMPVATSPGCSSRKRSLIDGCLDNEVTKSALVCMDQWPPQCETRDILQKPQRGVFRNKTWKPVNRKN